jgi:hypothetical protein
LSLIGSTRSDTTAQRAAIVGAHDDRREALKLARTELSQLAPSRTIEEVKADKAKILAATPQAGDCRGKAANAYRTVCARVAALDGEAARTKRRAELSATIVKLTDALAAGDVTKVVGHADAGAASLSTLLAALGWSVPAARLSDWIILLGAFAVETGAALSGVLVASVGGDKSPQSTGSQAVRVVPEPGVRHSARRELPSPDTKPAKNPDGEPPKGGKRAKRKPSGKRTKNRTRKLNNVVRLVERAGGRVSTSNRTLAKQLGMSRSRTHELIKELEATGQVRVVADQNGTTVALVANAA